LAFLRRQKTALPRFFAKLSAMRYYFVSFFLLVSVFSAFGQKMLLLERANRARTTKLYIGDALRFRLVGKEDYWYTRSITDILPESNTLLLDNFPVKVSDIRAIKVRRKPVWRVLSGATFSLGATLALATTVGKVFYRDEGVDAPKLYTISAVSLGTGWFLARPRKLKMGEKHRLRIVEVKFPEPLIVPPPKQ
jgi:hypothetical protein